MNRIVRVKMGGVTSNLQENIVGMKVVKSFQREAEILNSFDQVNNEYFDANLKAAKIASIMEPAVDWVADWALRLFSSSHRYSCIVDS